MKPTLIKNEMTGEYTVPFKVYVKYINFAWDEELARMDEWVHARLHMMDWEPGDKKFWIGDAAEEVGLPSLKQITNILKDRDVDSDFFIIDSSCEANKTPKQQALYQELRGLRDADNV